MATRPVIRIRGARQNNLKNISIDLPTGELIVVTGVSGSGKSSLVFDTLYAEGQRRYVETFSAYARQFLDRMDKPLVDAIEGVPPAIAIDQTNPVRTSRSTVGTMTELADHLKLLYARAATLVCPGCNKPVQNDTVDGVVIFITSQPARTKVFITFEREAPESLDDAQLEEWLSAQGFTRVHAREGNKVRVVADRLVLSEDVDRSRMTEAVETAMRYGEGQCQVILDEKLLRFSSQLSCAGCNSFFKPPRPALFSFNSPIGACDSCRGFGRVIGIDAGLVIPDESLSLEEGAIKPWQSKSYLDCQKELLTHAKRRGVATDIAWQDLPQEHRDWVFSGDDGWKGNWTKQWYGIHRFFEHLESKAYKMHVRVLLSRYRSYTECPACHGARLKPEALNWKISGKTLAEVMALSIDEAMQWMKGVAAALGLSEPLPFHSENIEAGTMPKHVEGMEVSAAGSARNAAAELVLKEMASRLGFCQEVGLGYLTLDRQSRTLSGGEVQRINLTTALGTSLVNTLFVLDEPSIGLHSRDLQRLIKVLHRLRDAGNSLVVVEHDPEVMQAADRIIDIGPGPGEHGGTIQFNGSYQALRRSQTLTADYLSGRRQVQSPSASSAKEPPVAPRPGTAASSMKNDERRYVIRLQGVTANNLKNIDVVFPLEQLVVVTGVSGSGKSTLIQDVLYPAVCKRLGKSTETPGAFKSIEGVPLISDALLVDQSPIGKTTRSNPVVYVGAFDPIRKLFAQAPLSVQRGYTPGHFSFNSGTGRCPTCTGSGFEHVEMQFLSDVYLRCPDCNGTRYRDEMREVTVQGLSIADVLELTVSEALKKFEHEKDIHRRLKPLVDVGLGYLRLGQPVPTLSGGEAQRLKIAGHLADAAERAGRATKGMLLIFDEPTTGLHFDDISKLLAALRALVKAGHSLIVIEHNLDLILAADHLIDLGPEAGPAGGSLVVAGTIDEVMACPDSHTGVALQRARQQILERQTLRVEDIVYSDSLAEEESSSALQKEAAAGPMKDEIQIVHAREHNLKNISVNIPRNALTVISGVSGSGKSTLAFDILFSEGQRRYLESLNAYARQFVQPSSRPEVDAVFGIPPTVAIEQRTSRGGRKSTVGTLTEIHHFLRLLFVKLGHQHCPDCNIPIAPQPADSIVASILKDYKKQTVGLLAPLVIQRKGIYQDLAKWADARGHDYLRVDGEFQPTAKFPRLDRYKEHTIELPVGSVDVSAKEEGLLRDLVATALERGQGSLKLICMATSEERLFSTKRACPSCSKSLPEPEPRLFSYNTKLGWCPACTGTGLFAAALADEESGEEDKYLEATNDPEADPELACVECDGARLGPIARHILVNGQGIHEVSKQSLDTLPGWLSTVRKKFNAREKAIADRLLNEIEARVDFLRSVGLGYLSLDRAAPTLSGGEAQRIRLAAQLGSNLQGVCYILDEPSIGLHPENNKALLSLLRQLQQKGNTLVVVEHDEETIAMADHLIDIGPGAGRLGGEVIAQGSQDDLKACERSMTGRYLREPMHHAAEPRRPKPEHWLQIKEANLHNLRKVNVEIPLQRLTVITGVSGSGKSSLARDVLKTNLARVVHLQRSKAGRAQAIQWDGCAGIEGWEAIDRVLEVDQTPIGKTPRSTPGTYIGFWDDIRRLYAEGEDARQRGWTAQRFSFNTGNGRCESCEGQGWQTVEMNFLPNVRVLCDACGGSRFNAETRQALWRGRSIADVLSLSVEEAMEAFETSSTIHKPLELLNRLGLGYLTLGQPSPTLSGGESQRIKLVTELAKARRVVSSPSLEGAAALTVSSSKKKTTKAAAAKAKAVSGKTVATAVAIDQAGTTRARAGSHTLYILDEPTVGLHMADVEKLIHALHELVDQGHTVVVIEHNLDVWAQADWLIDLGPGGGVNGGKLVATGLPRDIAKKKTPTGRALAGFLR
ncbi:MAG: excinuclease ABC subunit UvrA [Proteobacteria bacterium]|nr:excinuclease ABC subunit UvrA [Pseudomonadota bacterium]